METVRLIIDEPAGGPWNMAVDEALLQSAADGVATLRFYSWDRPTLSLGYFQKYDDRLEHDASRDCPLVRRSTGGGAILHDRELTYSFAAPLQSRDVFRAEALYRIFHCSLIEVLEHWKVSASLCANRVKISIQDEPFLCFNRRSDGDVLVCGSKIAGSAQRRRRNVVLQHGSVLLGVSPRAPELPGLREIAEREVDIDELISHWQKRLRDKLDLSLHQAKLSVEEVEKSRLLETEKFSHSRWTQRR